MGDSQLVKEIIFELSKVAAELGKKPGDLTQGEFLAECDKFNSNQLKKVGGFKTLQKTYYPEDPKDAAVVQELKNHKQYVKKLERVAYNKEIFEKNLVEAVSAKINQLQIKITQLDSKSTKNYLDALYKVPLIQEVKEQRSICTIWSDQHFGTNVDKQEMGGKNEFNWTIGAQRLGMLCEQLATYKIEKRQLHSELVIFLIGDNIGGIIHNQEGPDFDLLVHQICGTISYYVQALNYLKQFFPKIRVVCQPGNHGRVQHKASKQRALNQKYDSFENIIFYSLSQVFATDAKLSFSVSKAPFSEIEIQGHRVYATHGDTVFETGNVGDMVPIRKMEQQINRINAEELNQGRKPFKMVCTGHVHHPMFTQVNSGVKVAINGCLIGSDSFALGIGIQSSHPVQILWETTKKYVQGDCRLIYVEEADADKRYQKIITPYAMELSVTKE